MARPVLVETFEEKRTKSFSIKALFKKLGPGLITGASDDDPSAIATHSQAGARFGFATLWAILFVYPLMVAVQQISARIGLVTGHGIAWNMHRHFPRWVVYPVVLSLFTANTIQLGADISAMGSALTLLIGGPALLYSVCFALFSLLLEVFLPYHRYFPYLKVLTLSLFAYAGTAFVIEVPWGEVAAATFLPSFSMNAESLTILVAIFGATLSPYIFFWQASEEVEDRKTQPGQKPLKKAPEQAPVHLERIKVDTATGMAFANLIAYFIILTCAVTLHAKGVSQIQSAAEAAEALRPVAGRFATLLFATGIIGTGLLAIPVLAGSAAYAIGEALRWRVGLSRAPHQAKEFYGVLAAAVLIGLGITFSGINPIRALFWAAVLNGVVASPILAMMMWVASKGEAMGEFTLSPLLKWAGWFTTGVLFASAVGLLVTMSR